MEKQALTLEQIRRLAKKMYAAGLHELELHNEIWSLKMRFPETCGPINALAAPAEKTSFALRAPMPGKVLLAHPCQRKVYVQPGQQVRHDELLALLKVGPLYLPLRSPADGRVVSIDVQQDQAVEFGSAIVQLEPLDAVSVTL